MCHCVSPDLIVLTILWAPCCICLQAGESRAAEVLCTAAEAEACAGEYGSSLLGLSLSYPGLLLSWLLL